MVEEKIFNAGCICSFKDRFRSFRFVAEADALIPAEHQQRNLPFSEDQQGMKRFLTFGKLMRATE